ncbi:hypothetical protein YC2023_109395 [Brassica napus]
MGLAADTYRFNSVHFNLTAPPLLSCNPNQVIRASSRYCCPFPFTESNLSLMVLSTNLTSSQ